ncbi:hypothetical protein DH2020_019903 [Rehmannia glutinosa]|uniref:GOLD domain-containing protein n=1 Tax=Rehmannia glutinosa TaxID=99300 RepID=A0ABR0WG32_REHGL
MSLSVKSTTHVTSIFSQKSEKGNCRFFFASSESENPTRGLRESKHGEQGRSIRCGWAAFALFGLQLLNMVSRISALSVTVIDTECVYEYVFYEGDTVSGNFVVVDHEYFWDSKHPGIDFTVTSPGGNTVHSLKGSTGDKFEFKAPTSGMYKFCFHNSHSTPESVSFSIHTGHIPNQHDLAKDEHLDPINVRIAELREKLEYVTLEQNYLRARDVSHRHKQAPDYMVYVGRGSKSH